MPSPQFTANVDRYDPYTNFRFAVMWENRYVAGISQISALGRSTEVIEFRDGGDPTVMRKQPGQTSYDPITLSQGVTHDPQFERWANRVWNYGGTGGGEISLKDFRKDIIIEMHDEAGRKVMAFNVYRAWVSRFQVLPELDSSANSVAIRQIELQHEGFERDLSVKEPKPTSFTRPL